MLRLIACTIGLIFFVSCNHTQDECDTNKELSRSLELSNSLIRQTTEELFKDFSNRLHDVRFADYCSRWKPEVDSIKMLTDSVVGFVNKLKGIVKKRMDGDNTNVKLSEREEIKSLYEQLCKYGNYMLNLNDEIKTVFRNRETNLIIHLDTAYNLFANKYFNNKSECSQLTALCKFENDICRFEADLTSFCNNRTMPIIEHYVRLNAIVGQSSNIVKPGDAIEITAGIGAFSRAANPIITINNEVSKINESAVAVHKIKAPQKPGLHYVPVKIEYYNADGTKAKCEYTLEYSVKE